MIGYKTDVFPEFFRSDSGYKVSTPVETDREIAETVHMQFDRLDLKTGMLITVPVPKEEEANGEKVSKAIADALEEAEE